MKVFLAILQEAWGLFVDDGAYAATILIWIGIVTLVLPGLGLLEALSPILLFAGLAAILIVNARRKACRTGR